MNLNLLVQCYPFKTLLDAYTTFMLLKAFVFIFFFVNPLALVVFALQKEYSSLQQSIQNHFPKEVKLHTKFFQ